MEVLRALMERSYLAHPAFGFSVPRWEVSYEKLALFNEVYELARELASTLSTASFAALRRDLVETLGDIFASFQAQAEDKYEGQFISELQGACMRLLNEELKWFAKPSRVRFVDLVDASARRNSIRMLCDRHFFGRLPQAVVAELRDLTAHDVERIRKNVAAGKLRREELSISTGATVRYIRAALNREFKALGVLDALSAYTKRKIQVEGLALEVSVPQATWWRNSIQGLDRPPHTLYAHFDETRSCPKAIVYLSQVGEKNGPTSCYAGAYEDMRLNPLQEIIGRVVGSVGTPVESPLKDYYAKQYHQSMSSEKFRRHFMRLPECLLFNSHMGWDVAPGSELEASLIARESKMIGPAGTFMVFDGARLLHRGGLIEEGERVALQVIFSDVTFPERVFSKVKRMFS